MVGIDHNDLSLEQTKCLIQANSSIAGQAALSFYMQPLWMPTFIFVTLSPGLGIGTRAAFYLIYFVVLFSTAMCTILTRHRVEAKVGSRSKDHSKRAQLRTWKTRTSLLAVFTGSILVLSAIIQKCTYGLSIYHGFIVIGLSFITVFSAMPAYFSLGMICFQHSLDLILITK